MSTFQGRGEGGMCSSERKLNKKLKLYLNIDSFLSSIVHKNDLVIDLVTSKQEQQIA